VRFLGRLVLFLVALILAIPAGTVTLAIGVVMEPTAHELIARIGVAMMDALFVDALGDGTADLIVRDMLFGLWLISVIILIVPVGLVGLIGETIGSHSFLYYSGLTGLLTAAIPWLMRGGFVQTPAIAAELRLTGLLFLTGAVAGLVYWAIAGRSAGRRREVPPPAV
jgi:hypothetical protein